MIQKLLIILLVQYSILTSNMSLGQEHEGFFQSSFFQKVFNGDNRFTIQSGMFHQFFDGTPVVNSERIDENKTFIKDPMNVWGARLNDSWGWTFRRKINRNSALSLEHTKYIGRYMGLFTEWSGPPRVRGKYLKKYSLNYLRLIRMNRKVELNFGLGVYYQWGTTNYALKTYYPFSCGTPAYFNSDPTSFNGMRKDLGLNLKSGIDYTPIEWLTLSLGVDWSRSIFLESRNLYGVDENEFFAEEYGITQYPSRNNLSLNFALGFNF